MKTTLRVCLRSPKFRQFSTESAIPGGPAWSFPDFNHKQFKFLFAIIPCKYGSPFGISITKPFETLTWLCGDFFSFRNWPLFVPSMRTSRPAIVGSDGGSLVKVIPIPPSVLLSGGLRWSIDKRELFYINRGKDGDNICAQHFNGGAPRQVTHFQGLDLFSFDWSARWEATRIQSRRAGE